ncbi:GNAT family N-acetyltransferase [Primorskyibacter flagellatus]|uniref:Protein N-acetyltransferase, RimJ/RimL family n=1 Tax=Primorskyibacter flagellatus TaxID=1387277 RepID=A0A1W2AVF3_9RHOB|nr:GNAT family protein [Primorskyibacter flagellatus]SMC64717.1 Protein N-acetyltransferase, RimJ/RimL family [Primorskyibacter flagellatus]
MSNPYRHRETIEGWSPPPRPAAAPMNGRYCLLEPLRTGRHAAALFDAYHGNDAVWDYLPYGPFSSLEHYAEWLRSVEGLDDPSFYAIHDNDAGRWGGVAAYLRITPQAGSIEVGHINLAPALQGTRAATEAIYLMMRHAFEAGYRRFEWKCDALNMGSRRAAQRLGFSYEGVFRQATVVKGHNRDTAWFAMIDKEWPALQTAFDTWLDPDNFAADGQQKTRLSDLTKPVRFADDPALAL